MRCAKHEHNLLVRLINEMTPLRNHVLHSYPECPPGSIGRFRPGSVIGHYVRVREYTQTSGVLSKAGRIW